MSSVWFVIVFVIVWSGIGEYPNNCVVVGSQIFPHPEVPEIRDYGWRDEQAVWYVLVIC